MKVIDIETLFEDYIKDKNRVPGSAVKQINSWLSAGVISNNAATYMKALLKHHGISLYENIGVLKTEAISDTADDYFNEHPDVKVGSRTLDYWLAQNGYSGDSATLFKAYLQDNGAEREMRR